MPHHVQLFWTRSGELAFRCKRWVSGTAWGDPVELCTPSQVAQLRAWWPPLLHPQWDQSFAKSALSWLAKLRSLMQFTASDLGGLAHCERMLRHEAPEYLPSGVALQAKIQKMRRHGWGRGAPSTLSLAIANTLQSACAAAFPGSATGRMGFPLGFARLYVCSCVATHVFLFACVCTRACVCVCVLAFAVCGCVFWGLKT